MFALRRAAIAAAPVAARASVRPFSVMGARFCNYRSLIIFYQWELGRVVFFLYFCFFFLNQQECDKKKDKNKKEQTYFHFYRHEIIYATCGYQYIYIQRSKKKQKN